MTEIREGQYSFTYRSEESREVLVLRSKKAVLISKRIEAYAKFGQMALPRLGGDPEFAEQAEKIAGFSEEIRAIEAEMSALEEQGPASQEERGPHEERASRRERPPHKERP